MMDVSGAPREMDLTKDFSSGKRLAVEKGALRLKLESTASVADSGPVFTRSRDSCAICGLRLLLLQTSILIAHCLVS